MKRIIVVRPIVTNRFPKYTGKIEGVYCKPQLHSSRIVGQYTRDIELMTEDCGETVPKAFGWLYAPNAF